MSLCYPLSWSTKLDQVSMVAQSVHDAPVVSAVLCVPAAFVMWYAWQALEYSA